MDLSKLITDNVNLATATVKEAPRYNHGEKLLKIDACIVVKQGTEKGNPSVDFQLSDENGNKYVVMATGNIIETIGGYVKGVRLSTKAN